MSLRTKSDENWRFSEIRPDAVVGVVPNGNPMYIAQKLGLWLSLVREVEGEGAEVVFPGSERAWRARNPDSSQGLVGGFAVNATLRTEGTNGKIVNIADGVTTWEGDRPGICALFRLRGLGPRAGVVTGKEWVMAKKDRWAGWVTKYGLNERGVRG